MTACDEPYIAPVHYWKRTVLVLKMRLEFVFGSVVMAAMYKGRTRPTFRGFGELRGSGLTLDQYGRVALKFAGAETEGLHQR